MFEAKEKNEKRVVAALAVLREYGRGECVPHSKLEHAVGLAPEPGGMYYKIVEKARLRLRDEDGIWSRNQNSEGFYLYTQSEQLIEEPTRRAKRARKQVRYVINAAKAIPKEDLTFHQRRLRDATIDSAKELHRKMASRETFAKESMKAFKGSPLRKADSQEIDLVNKQASA